MALYADILLPVAIPRPFTYAVPESWETELREGMLVRVPLGKNKICEGVVRRIHTETPATKSEPKTILEILTSVPYVTPEQLHLWEWIADYYMCTAGEVMKAALPAGIRYGSYAPSTELFVRLTPDYRTAEKVGTLLETLRRAKAQSKALLAYLALIPCDAEGEPFLKNPHDAQLWVERSLITEAVPASAILKLIERGILEQIELIPTKTTAWPKTRFPVQNTPALFQPGLAATLLYGNYTPETLIPIYLKSIKQEVSAGKQVLILLPETLTHTGLIESVQEILGNRCAVYHARLTDRARSALYYRMIEEPESVDVVIGTRTALFLPFRQLGLVVVDQEHDGAYRQHDPAPRYQGRDVALMLAHEYGAKTVLASPTPSVESWYNMTFGKYGAYPLEKNPSNPKVTVLERGKGLISKYLSKRIEETLQGGKQVVLFQNRRGFAPYVECGSCGYTPMCRNCNVTLTYHKEHSVLQCHYCGSVYPYISTCPSCGLQTLVPRGIGTERIEEEIATRFPEVKVARIDTDVAKTGARKIGRILSEFSGKETGILVGTQMVARTAQMGDVGLVGVVNADNMLSYPDFRAAERAFQLLMQLKALPGEDGELVIQSSQRLHPVLIAVHQTDPEGFYSHELEERQKLLYPPYVRMIRLTLRHADRKLTHEAARELYDRLQKRFGKRISPPFEPSVDRIQGQHILHLLLRIERERSVVRAKAILSEILDGIRKQFSTVHLAVEVDPQ